jgi:general transcriptional corepressor CYC8
MAKEEYERVLEESPNHAKVLQQLGWLCQQQNTGFTSLDLALKYLNKSLDSGTSLLLLFPFNHYFHQRQ